MLPGDYAGRDDLITSLERPWPMNKAATLADVGAVAAFVASDQARSITDTWINIGFGAMPE